VTLAQRIEDIENRIVLACQRAGRNRSDVTLIAVSKTFPASLIREAYALGIREFGESRLQEALPKITELPADITWHMIGHLQSNKFRKAAENFALIHTLDSPSQLEVASRLSFTVDALIEVNIAEEAKKTGIFPGDIDRMVEDVLSSKNVRLRGLMTLGPAEATESEKRAYFRRMRDEADRIGKDILSMGMSGDFEIAIEEGSTHIRVGTAIFGER